MLEVTQHGVERLFERIQSKSQKKNKERAKRILMKVIEKGITVVNDTQQMLVVYAENLYIFRKNLNAILFITVKTSTQQRFDSYVKGQRRALSIKKNFAISA